tara:strand:- start:106 stop:531 length:426 start_codon:yes stop_codon:yes gene_type:complete
MTTTKALILSAALVLAACSSPVQYRPGAAPAQPQKVVERLLHEHAGSAPFERVVVSEEWFEFAEPSYQQRRLMVLRETVQQPVVRVYYRSIAKINVYQSRGTWYVVPEAKDGREMATVASTSQQDAQQFADALVALGARPQ